MIKILCKILRLTCVAHREEIANVGGALSVYDSHSLRAQSLLKQVRRAHSPHQRSMLLPYSWCSYYSIHIDHSRGVHGDIVTRERLDIPHLRQKLKRCGEY